MFIFASHLRLRGDTRPKVELYEINVQWTFGFYNQNVIYKKHT